MSRPRINLSNYVSGAQIIKEIQDYAQANNCKPEDLEFELEKEYGYYDDVDVAAVLYAPTPKDKRKK